MKSKILGLAIILAFGINNVNAQAAVGAKNQHHRIREGVRSGELTKGEAANLRHDQKEIHQEVKEARFDGEVTPAEKSEIRQDRLKESREIFRKKHNARDRN